MNKRIQLIIIIVELVILIGLSSYRIYEVVTKDEEEIKENETVKKYKVTFDYGYNAVRSIEVEENKKIEFPDEPLKKGYIFDSWLLNNALIDENYEVKEDITLKANWINENINSEIKILVYEINIRQEADVNSSDLGDVYMNQVYEVLDIVETDTYTWYKIKKDNIVGYVANQKGENWVEYNDLKQNDKDENNNSNNSGNAELEEEDLIKISKLPFTRYPEMLNSYYLKDTFEVENASSSVLNTLAFQNAFYWSHPEITSIDGTFYTLNGNNLETYFKNFFGPDVVFEHSNFEFIPICFAYGDEETFNKRLKEYGVVYDNVNNIYSDIVFGNCGSQFTYDYAVNEIFKTEKSDNEIYVYSYMFYYGFDVGVGLDPGHAQNEWNDGNEAFERPYPCHVNSWLGDTIHDSGSELCEVNIIGNLKQENKIPIYKATFKKQSDGNYYFNKGEWVTK